MLSCIRELGYVCYLLNIFFSPKGLARRSFNIFQGLLFRVVMGEVTSLEVCPPPLLVSVVFFLSLVLIFVVLSNFGSLPIKISTMVAPKNKDPTNLFITIH